MRFSFFKYFRLRRKDTSNKAENLQNDSVSTFMEEFMKRPIYKHLTIRIIDSADDNELIQIVIDNIDSKIKNYRVEYETVKRLSEGRQAIYSIWKLEGEVNNGGFNQFYYNPSGKYANDVLDGLKLIGAEKFEKLVRRANNVYDKEKANISRAQDGTLEGFSESYKNNPLNGLDNEFYDLYEEEDITRIQIDFIRKNKQEFVDR